MSIYISIYIYKHRPSNLISNVLNCFDILIYCLSWCYTSVGYAGMCWKGTNFISPKPRWICHICPTDFRASSGNLVEPGKWLARSYIFSWLFRTLTMTRIFLLSLSPIVQPWGHNNCRRKPSKSFQRFPEGGCQWNTPPSPLVNPSQTISRKMGLVSELARSS